MSRVAQAMRNASGQRENMLDAIREDIVAHHYLASLRKIAEFARLQPDDAGFESILQEVLNFLESNSPAKRAKNLYLNKLWSELEPDSREFEIIAHKKLDFAQALFERGERIGGVYAVMFVRERVPQEKMTSITARAGFMVSDMLEALSESDPKKASIMAYDIARRTAYPETAEIAGSAYRTISQKIADHRIETEITDARMSREFPATLAPDDLEAYFKEFSSKEAEREATLISDEDVSRELEILRLEITKEETTAPPKEKPYMNADQAAWIAYAVMSDEDMAEAFPEVWKGAALSMGEEEADQIVREQMSDEIFRKEFPGIWPDAAP